MGQYPLTNSVPFNYGWTVYSDGTVEMGGTCLENKEIRFPFPVNPDNYSVLISLYDGTRSASNSLAQYGCSVHSNTMYYFKCRCAPDDNATPGLEAEYFFRVSGGVTKEVVDHLLAGHVFDPDTKEWDTSYTE